MKRFTISPLIEAEYTATEKVIFGQLFHVEKGGGGWGSLSTPIANYFVTQPEFIEGYNEHWRLDCFFRTHDLSPDPMSAGQDLVNALVRERLCAEPIWLSVHRSEELEGKAFGEVFEAD